MLGHDLAPTDPTTRILSSPDRLAGYQGYLKADAYSVYDAFYKGAKPVLTEVACWAHARRYAFHARETDTARMGVL